MLLSDEQKDKLARWPQYEFNRHEVDEIINDTAELTAREIFKRIENTTCSPTKYTCKHWAECSGFIFSKDCPWWQQLKKERGIE